jgi:hypothetical protein
MLFILICIFVNTKSGPDRISPSGPSAAVCVTTPCRTKHGAAGQDIVNRIIISGPGQERNSRRDPVPCATAPDIAARNRALLCLIANYQFIIKNGPGQERDSRRDPMLVWTLRYDTGLCYPLRCGK